jgi:hypothetical protein
MLPLALYAKRGDGDNQNARSNYLKTEFGPPSFKPYLKDDPSSLPLTRQSVCSWLKAHIVIPRHRGARDIASDTSCHVDREASYKVGVGRGQEADHVGLVDRFSDAS